MIGWLRTLLFFIGWFFITLIVGGLGLPSFVRQEWVWAVSRVWAWATLAWLQLTCGIRSTLRGMENLPEKGGLIACKHQSAWDTIIYWRVLGNPAFVLKRGLYYIPIFGWYLWRSGQVSINRKAGREAVRDMLAGAERIIAQKRTLVIFPEGTRVRPGEEPSFHAGVARLSQQMQLPVTPAALNAGLVWPKHTLRKNPGEAIIEFLPAVPAFSEPMLPWLTQLQRVINTKSAQLEQEATPQT